MFLKEKMYPKYLGFSLGDYLYKKDTKYLLVK